MDKFIAFLFIIVLAILADIAFFNMDQVTITIYNNHLYTLPKVALIIISSTIGALFVSFVFFLSGTKRYIRNKQTQKKRKTEEKINNSYSKALQYMAFGNKPDEAVVHFNNVLKEDSSHILSLIRLGDIYLEKDDLKKAGEYYQKARNLDSENREVLLKLTILKEKAGQINDALALVEDILSIDSNDISAIYKKREFFESLSKWDDLVYLQKTILKRKSSDEEKEIENRLLIGYEYEYGRQSLENNELEKSKKAFKTALKTDKFFIPAHLGMAEVILTEGNAEEAVNYLEKTYSQVKSIILLIRLEDLLINTGEPSRLLRIYRNAITEEPDRDTLKLFLGKLYYRLEMLDDAMDVLNSVDSGMFFQETCKLRGSIYLKRNQYEDAAQEFLKVLDMKSALHIPYSCSNCDYLSLEWSGRCPECKKWNTYGF